MSIIGKAIQAARNSTSHNRAKRLAQSDYKYVRDLVAARRAAGLSQLDVADRMGISQQAVSKIEKYDGDPRLSTLRRYAHAVEALVDHVVTPESTITRMDGPRVLFITSSAPAPRQYLAPKKPDFALAG